MIRGAAEQNEYFGGQMVEVRNTHNGRETWRPAKIHRRTSRGCEVVYRDGTDQRPQHIMFSDLRPMEKSSRPTAKVATPLLSASDIDAYNARLEAEERERKAAEAAKPQPLVLVRRMPEAVEPRSPSGRRLRSPKKHFPTPLSTLLRNRRAEKGMQQRALAQRSKLHQSRLSTIEFGDTKPTDNELLELAVALDLDYDELVKLRASEGLPAAKFEPEPEPEPELHEQIIERLPLHAPTLREDILEPRKPVPAPLQQTVDVERLLRELDRLKEENTILRGTVVFFAGLERS